MAFILYVSRWYVSRMQGYLPVDYPIVAAQLSAQARIWRVFVRILNFCVRA
jgi:hypothetical protein